MPLPMFVRKAYVTPRPYAEPISVPNHVELLQRGGEEYDKIAKSLLRTFRSTPIINEFENRMTYSDFVMYCGSQLQKGEQGAANGMMDVQKYKSTVNMLRDPQFNVALKRVFNNAT